MTQGKLERFGDHVETVLVYCDMYPLSGQNKESARIIRLQRQEIKALQEGVKIYKEQNRILQFDLEAEYAKAIRTAEAWHACSNVECDSGNMCYAEAVGDPEQCGKRIKKDNPLSAIDKELAENIELHKKQMQLPPGHYTMTSVQAEALGFSYKQPSAFKEIIRKAKRKLGLE